MNFFSLTFPICLFGAVLLYYLLPQKVQWVFLLLVSLGFYAMGGWKPLVFLGITALSTFGTGLLLEGLNRKAAEAKARGERTAAPVGRKRLALTLCLVLNFGILYTLKYWNSTAAALREAGLPDLSLSGLLLPLGLSFYMFQSIGYTVDCYRGKYPAQRNPLRYLLFVSFFPQMVQGPISRYDQLAPQLMAGHRFDAENLRSGIQLALWGYCKKLLIADRAAVVVNAVFREPGNYGGFFYAFAVLFYCIQLYCDFSGGIDITRGAARMFGIDLAENFHRPIFAVSLAEYWRRWHITLGTWMRDYVFYPLSFSRPFAALGRWSRKRFGGKPGKVVPTACATFVVYLIIGVWHGASFRYVVFGLYNGVILTASILLAKPFSAWRKRLKAEAHPGLWHGFRLLRTMAIVFVGRYLTRAGSLALALRMLGTTLRHPCLYQLRDGTFGALSLRPVDYAAVGLGTIVLLLVEWRAEKGVDVQRDLAKRHGFVQWLAVFVPLVLLLWTLLLSGSAVDVNLIYQQY